MYLCFLKIKPELNAWLSKVKKINLLSFYHYYHHDFAPMSDYCRFYLIFFFQFKSIARLLETRREDLILVLLEEIPRRLRPNTLHYLMLTKTYIVWPEKDKSEQSVFWRRMKKSLVTHKLQSTENVTLS